MMIGLEYLAGLVDGEGCITIFRHRTAACRDDHWTYRPLLQIGMTHIQVIRMLHAQFGGQISYKAPRSLTRRPYAVWTVRGGRGVDLVKAIQPFLIVKRAEADLLIQFWSDPLVRLPGGTMRRLHGAEREAVKAKREYYRLALMAAKKADSPVGDVSEFGGTSMPGCEDSAEGQSRAKQIKLVA